MSESDAIFRNADGLSKALRVITGFILAFLLV